MTMPSFPNLPVLFPDEAVFLNQKGFRPAVSGILPPHLQFFTNPEDPAEIVKKGWDAQSRRVVLDGLANNKSKEMGMLGRKGRSVMPDSSLTGLRGGAVTKEGRSMARQFLTTRAENKALTRDASFFSPTAQLKGTELAPPDTRTLYITLLAIADEIQVGNVTEGTLSKLNSATASLLQIAPVLSGKQMGQIIDFLSSMIQSSQVLVFREKLNASQRRMIASVISQLQRLDVIIRRMAQTSSPQEREIIGRQIVEFLKIGEDFGDIRELEDEDTTLFKELGTAAAEPAAEAAEAAQPAAKSRRGRPPNSEYRFPPIPEGQQTFYDLPFAKDFSSSSSVATGSTGNPRAPLPSVRTGEGRYRRKY